MVREIFALARTKPACILFFDEIDSFGGVRHGGVGEGEGDNEVQRTMLELLNQLDGFDRRGSVKAGITLTKKDDEARQTEYKAFMFMVNLLVRIFMCACCVVSSSPSGYLAVSAVYGSESSEMTYKWAQ